MTNAVNLREITCDVLLEIEKEKTPSHVALGRMLEKYQYLENKERRFISRLTRGTLERQISIDWMIEQFSSVKVRKMKPVIRTILRMSVYQMVYMDSVPISAICNEAVKLTKKRGFKNLSGFVNGVLRNMDRHPEKRALPKDDPAVYYAQPQWLVDEWYRCYGADVSEKMFQFFLEKHPITVRINENRISPEAFMQRMKAQGITAVQNKYVPQAFELSGYDYLGMIEEFSNGCCTVQDISSMLVAIVADVQPSDQVIDVCAAPGGKSIQISEKLSDKGLVRARDLTEYKVGLIEDAIERMQAEHIQAECQDALEQVDADIETADIVIADLPCSGLGVIGKKPDIKHRLKPEDIQSLAKLQRDILTQVSEYVKPGGHLIYSTCTVDLDENQKNVQWFLEHFPFEAESLEKYIPKEMQEPSAAKGYIQLFPGKYNTDGFFIARFCRRK